MWFFSISLEKVMFFLVVCVFGGCCCVVGVVVVDVIGSFFFGCVVVCNCCGSYDGKFEWVLLMLRRNEWSCKISLMEKIINKKRLV